MKLRSSWNLFRALPLLLALGGLAGCDRYFAANGVVASHGGALGTWRTTPQGCTRDPFDGLPASESTSVLTFLWDDPGIRDPLRDLHRPTELDLPLRLQVARAAGGYSLQLDNVKTRGTHFDSGTCATLTVETHETPRTLPEGKPTLAGSIRFDCPTDGGRVTADIHFQRCEY